MKTVIHIFVQISIIRGIFKELKIQDVTGREYPADTIFTLSIKALKDHFKETVNRQHGSDIEDNEIKWVLTVPAIWNEAAKKFMRACAVKAGIQDKMLQLALEPEAASIYVQYLPMERKENGFGMTKKGTKYMVVDIGGGTFDVTVHEKTERGKLREIHQATGGPYGGTVVDDAFEHRLTEILGEKVMKTLREKRTETYLDIFGREFELAKRGLKSTGGDTIRMTISYVVLDELCREIEKKKLKDMFKDVKGMHIKGDKLHISPETMKQFFDKQLKEIIKNIQALLKKPIGISLVLLVGGSAESEYIQSELQKAISKDSFARLVIPPEPSLAVLKGAVIFGHCPTIITSRILRFTYGTSVTPEFDPEIHKTDKKMSIEGVDRCMDCFSSIVRAGEEITVGHKITQTYETATSLNFGAMIKIFCSPQKEVKYTDDEECFELGEICVPLPGRLFTALIGMQNHPFTLEYVFGDTEIKITGTDLISGCCSKGSLKMKEDDTKENES